MTIRYSFRPLGRLNLLAVPLLFATTAALAQTLSAAPPTQKKPVASHAAPAPFKSALEGYKPYTEQKLGNWKEANDRTARVGGWRAYAKEAAQPETDSHAEHGKPTQGKP